MSNEKLPAVSLKSESTVKKGPVAKHSNNLSIDKALNLDLFEKDSEQTSDLTPQWEDRIVSGESEPVMLAQAAGPAPAPSPAPGTVPAAGSTGSAVAGATGAAAFSPGLIALGALGLAAAAGGGGGGGSAAAPTPAPPPPPPPTVIGSNGGGATATVSVSENTTAVTTVAASSETGTIVYSISGGADASKFTINASTGVLTFVAAPDYEIATDVGANRVYDVTVQATNGTTTDTQSIAVTVLNVTTTTILSSATVSVAENSAVAATVVAVADAGDPVSYAIAGGDDAALFEIDANTGVLTFIAVPNYESGSPSPDAGADYIYNVIVEATDGTTTAQQTLNITVTPLSESNPVFSSSAAFSVSENATAVGTVVATDADLPSLPITYELSGDDAAKFSITSGGVLSFVAAPNYELPTDVGANNVYNLTVTASDGAGGTTTQAVAVTVTPLDEFNPVFTSSATFNVAENASAVGTVVATDADLPAPGVTYGLSGDDAARFNIDASTGVLSFAAAPDYEVPEDGDVNNVYNLIVTANDGASGTSTQSVTVTVTAVNEFNPAFTSSATFSVAENATAVGTVVATDADLPAQSVTYALSGTDAAKFGINASTGVLSFLSAPNFEAPTDAGTDNVYDLIVTASDGALTTTQAVSVTVTAVNEFSPVFTSSAAFSVAENTTAVGTVIATDADMPALGVTYAISGADAAKFSLNASTGVLAFASAPDFEVPTDAGTPSNNVYDLIITASDGAGNSTMQSIAVTVTDVGALAFSSATTAFSVAENATSVTTIAAVSETAITYSIVSGVDSAKFTINPTTGALTFNAPPDYETPLDVGTVDNVYNLTVLATDGDGSVDKTIAVTVTPVNDNNPVFTSSAAFSVAENATTVGTVVATDADLPSQTVTYALTGGADQAKFNINASTGALTFATGPNYEVPTDVGTDNLYNVVVTASDGASGTTTQAIAVTVTPVNDNNPVFTSSAAFSVAENATTVGTVVATDADLPSQTVTYSLTGGADLAKFNINASTGALTFATGPNYEVPTDVGTDNVYNLIVTASDGASGTTTQAIAVTVTPVNDNNPVFTSSAAFSVAENATTVGTVVATDADLPSQTVTYSLTGGADQAKFNINASTGALTFVTGPNFEAPTDVGADNVYDVVVTASDGASGTTTQAIAVSVTGVNEFNPVFTSSAAFSVAENATTVGTVVATDADLPSTALSYSLTGGADLAKFNINASTGALTFATGPNYEVPTDSGGNNVYDLIVTASDGTKATTQSVAVTVTPVNEFTPVAVANSYSATTDATLTVTALSGVLTNDTDGDVPPNLSAVLVTNVTNGALVLKSDGSFTYTPTTSYVGSDSFTYKAFDGLNNSSAVTVSLTVAAVSTPSTPDLKASSDLGISNSDNLTADNTPTVTGTGASAGGTVTLYDTDGTTVLGTGIADGSGAWEITSSALLDGAHTLSAKHTDLGSNTSGASAGLTVNIDTVRPGYNSASFGTGTTVVLGFDDVVYAGVNDLFLSQNPTSNNWNGTSVSITSIDGTGSNTLTLNTSISHSGTDFIRVRMDSTLSSAVMDAAGNKVASREVYVGGGGDNTIDLSNYYNPYYGQHLRGNGGKDSLEGTRAADLLVDGGGADTLRGGEGADLIRLVENGGLSGGATYSRDVVNIEIGDSTIANMDVINQSGTSPTGSGFDAKSETADNHDQLRLQSNLIASNATLVDGSDSGTLAKHSITSGIVTFAATNDASILINKDNLSAATTYLSTNITSPGTTVAFEVDTDNSGTTDSLYVFQDNGLAPDTLVQLVAVTGVTLGTSAGANVVQLLGDQTAPEPVGFNLTTNGVHLDFAENAFATTGIALSLVKNGVTGMTITEVTGSGSSSIDISTNTTLSATDWVLLKYTATSALDGFRDANNNYLSGDDDTYGGSAEGSSGNNTIDLSNVGVFDADGYDLNGAAGNDLLIGSSAGDNLTGDAGVDTMTGGAGSDRFDLFQGDTPVGVVNLAGDSILNNGDTFTFAGGVDRITDLSSGENFQISAPDYSGAANPGWMGTQSSNPSTSALPTNGLATDQGFFFVQGALSGTVFTANTAGADTLVVYDGDSSSGITQSGVVLSGVTLAQLNAFSLSSFVSHV
ncbi:MAG: cadherin domain-containing protein [Pseudomonadota bacterium]